MRLCKEYDTGSVVCHLVQVASDFYFTTLVGGKLTNRRNLGQDEVEAVKDFEAEVQMLELENGV